MADAAPLSQHIHNMETWGKVGGKTNSRKTVYVENSVLSSSILDPIDSFLISRWGGCSFSKCRVWHLTTEKHKN